VRLQRRLQVIVAALSMLGGELRVFGGDLGGDVFGCDGRLWLHKTVGGEWEELADDRAV
jgi:hypothetical protein